MSGSEARSKDAHCLRGIARVLAGLADRVLYLRSVKTSRLLLAISAVGDVCVAAFKREREEPPGMIMEGAIIIAFHEVMETQGAQWHFKDPALHKRAFDIANRLAPFDSKSVFMMMRMLVVCVPHLYANRDKWFLFLFLLIHVFILEGKYSVMRILMLLEPG